MQDKTSTNNKQRIQKNDKQRKTQMTKNKLQTSDQNQHVKCTNHQTMNTKQSAADDDHQTRKKTNNTQHKKRTNNKC